MERKARRIAAGDPTKIKEGKLLYHLIQKDHRSLVAIARELGVDPSYLSTKRLQNVTTLSSKIATSATVLWGLSPDYFEKYVKTEEIDKKQKELQDRLNDIDDKLTEILFAVKKRN